MEEAAVTETEKVVKNYRSEEVLSLVDLAPNRNIEKRIVEALQEHQTQNPTQIAAAIYMTQEPTVWQKKEVLGGLRSLVADQIVYRTGANRFRARLKPRRKIERDPILLGIERLPASATSKRIRAEKSEAEAVQRRKAEQHIEALLIAARDAHLGLSTATKTTRTGRNATISSVTTKRRSGSDLRGQETNNDSGRRDP